MDWLKQTLFPNPPNTYSCPSPELSVSERRQCYADALLKSARLYYDVSKFEEHGCGSVRLFTKIRKHGENVDIIDGWMRVENPLICPDLSVENCSAPDKRDFFMSIPSVMYFVEVDVGDGRVCGLGFSLYAGRSDMLPNKPSVVAMTISPIHGSKWKNYDYENSVYFVTHSMPPSCTKFVDYRITELTGCEMRDLLKISALLNYFKCTDWKRLRPYHFVTGSGYKLTVSVGYKSESCVVAEQPWLVQIGLERPYVLQTLRDVMDWAEKVK
jgi:hypothetical protein